MQTIGIFVKNLTSGGAEKQAVLLAKTVADACRVHFIVFNGDKVHTKYLDSLKENVRVSVVMFKGGHFSRFLQLVKYIKAYKINVIFSYLTAANFYASIAGLITGVNVYTGLRNVDLPRKKRIVDRFLTNHLVVGTVVNSYMGYENFVRHGFLKKKLFVIANGFENIKFYKTKAFSDTVKIITVGRFHLQKDYGTALNAFARLHVNNKNTEYLIVGYGSEEQMIRERIKELNLDTVCKVLINPDNIPELLDSADVYLSTSLIEGTSNSIMEAMNAALPVVATNVGDNSYLVENGRNGYVLPVKDVEGIAGKLIELTENISLRQSMGRESQNILREKYSLKVFRESYLNLITEEA